MAYSLLGRSGSVRGRLFRNVIVVAGCEPGACPVTGEVGLGSVRERVVPLRGRPAVGPGCRTRTAGYQVKLAFDRGPPRRPNRALDAKDNNARGFEVKIETRCAVRTQPEKLRVRGLPFQCVQIAGVEEPKLLMARWIEAMLDHEKAPQANDTTNVVAREPVTEKAIGCKIRAFCCTPDPVRLDHWTTSHPQQPCERSAHRREQ